jgi:hypothetical protein
MGLQIHPTLGVGAKKTGQPQGRIRGNRPFSRDDFSDAPLLYADRLGKPVRGNLHGFQKIFQQNFAGIHRGQVSFHGFSPLMVINNFDIIRMAVLPVEAYPPLIVDPDAPLAFSLTPQLFQPVSRRYAKKFQSCRAMDLGQFAQGYPMYVLRQSGCKCALKDLSRILVTKSLDHVETGSMARQYCQAILKRRDRRSGRKFEVETV